MTKSQQFSAAIETVTPQMAYELLASNKGNRHIIDEVVDEYATDMASGNWELNGEGIKITEDGRLLDGQHRLSAIARIKQPIQMLVLRNVPAEVFDTLDTGRKRTFADVLSIKGEKYTNQVAAAVRLVWFYEQYGNLASERTGRRRPTIRQLEACLDRHPGIRESLRSNGHTGPILLLPRSRVTALHYLFSHVDAQDADVFFHKLEHGENLAKGDAIYALREVFIRELNNVGMRRMRLTYSLAYTIKAFNAWRAGDEVHNLRWRGGGANKEPFPEIEGCLIPTVGQQGELVDA